MSSVLQTDERSAKDINDKGFDGNQRAELYAQLKQREHVWWQARQQLTLLKERQMSWFGDDVAALAIGQLCYCGDGTDAAKQAVRYFAAFMAVYWLICHTDADFYRDALF